MHQFLMVKEPKQIGTVSNYFEKIGVASIKLTAALKKGNKEECGRCGYDTQGRGWAYFCPGRSYLRNIYL